MSAKDDPEKNANKAFFQILHIYDNIDNSKE